MKARATTTTKANPKVTAAASDMADRCVDAAIQSVVETGHWDDFFDPMYDATRKAPIEELHALLNSHRDAAGEARVAFALGVAFGRRLGSAQ